MAFGIGFGGECFAGPRGANSYATGSVFGLTAGGLVGQNFCYALQITRSYAAGAVDGVQFAGGVVGFDQYQGTLRHAYWDTTASGITNLSPGAGNIANDPGIRGLSNPRLQSHLPGGLSAKIWGDSPAINGGLPYLLANPPPE